MTCGAPVAQKKDRRRPRRSGPPVAYEGTFDNGLPETPRFVIFLQNQIVIFCNTRSSGWTQGPHTSVSAGVIAAALLPLRWEA